MLRAEAVSGRVYSFALPAGATEVWLASRGAVPAEVQSPSRDLRRLGAPVDRLVLRGGGVRTEIGHEYPGLYNGFYENEEWCRWTGGTARLPGELLRAFDGELTLEVHLIETDLRYLPEPIAA